MSLLKVNEVQNYNGSSLTLTASTVSTSAQLNTGGNISVTGSINVSDDSTTRSNLGLGTIATQDSDNVTVTGGTATLGALTVSGSDSGDLVRITQTGSGNALVVEDSANPDSTPFVVDASGNVGIGTDSPAQLLHLKTNSTGSTRLRLENSEGNAEICADGTDGFLTAGGTEILRFESNGNLLVGTTTVVAKSTFYGTSSIGANAAIGIIDDEGDRATIGLTNGGNLYIKAEDGEVYAVDSAGNATLLSPHNFEMIPDGASESGAWAFYSRNGDIENDLGNTTYVNVDMMKVVRLVENLTGVKLLYTGSGTDTDTSTVTQNIIESQQSQIDALTARIEALETA